MVAAVASIAFSSQALADDQAAIEKLVQMNKKALDDYDTLEWEGAKKTLLDALMYAKKQGLDNHPVMARTYVHLGAVYITGFKNRDKAIQSFSRALEIDPAIQLSKGIATADVSDAFAEAKRAKGMGGGGGGETTGTPPPAKKRRGPIMEGDEGAEAPPPRKKAPARSSTSDDEDSEEQDLPAKIQALDCPNEDEAIIDKAATLRCAVAPNLPVKSVYLMYLEPGKDEYSEVQMTRSPKGWYVGKIPKKAVTGKSVAYFFEGRDASGKAIIRNGDRDGPNHLLLMEEEAYKNRKREDLGEDKDNPLLRKKGPKKKGSLGHATGEEGKDVDFGNRKWWIGLGAGSGFGYAKGNGLEAVNRSPDPNYAKLSNEFAAGGAWAGLGHLAPELGVALTPDWAISIEGRFQYIPQPAKYSSFAARGAISGLLKVMRYTQQAQVRFFGTGIVGGGEGFRFVVQPVDTTFHPELAQVSDFKDTVRGGPAVVGAGGGVYYEASRRASIVFEVHGLAGLPIFSFVADANLSLQINFYSEKKRVSEEDDESGSSGGYVPKEEDEEPK
ncbi:MAG TPA: hypothetical protein VIF57_24775 [Polyangia bacterium]|jgi:hypothetical protein